MHLPIGISDFGKLIRYRNNSGAGYLFVDKSLFIKEILADSGTEVIVLTRPRRFGKTLNLSMLQHFFAAEVDGKPTVGLFDGLEISKDPELMKYQGQSPVIFISLKDIKGKNFATIMDRIYEEVRTLFDSHRYLLGSDKISIAEKNTFNKILEKTAPLSEIENTLLNLSGLLRRFFDKEVYILIDEYDTPIQEAYLHGYYNDMIDFMRGLFGKALKGNANLKQAILTGILRVSKESLFSSLNNVVIYSILNKKYSKFFGFTEDEVNDLLSRANMPTDTKQTKEWYNGYNFGGNTIYNPWSIVQFIKEEGQIGPYWINTGSNDLIRQLINNAATTIKDKIAILIAGGSITEIIDEHVVFADLNTNQSALWNLFFMTGYLKATLVQKTIDGEECELSIPNKEVESIYRRVIREWLSGARGLDWYRAFLDDLANGRVQEFEEKLQTLIEETVSYHDTTKNSQEVFYHGLMLGIVAGLRETHEVKSNKESGRGRYDVAIIPKDLNKLGIIIEFKAPQQKEQQEINLAVEAELALEQIKQSNYIAELKQRGISKICMMGIAFFKKEVRIVTVPLQGMS